MKLIVILFLVFVIWLAIGIKFNLIIVSLPVIPKGTELQRVCHALYNLLGIGLLIGFCLAVVIDDVDNSPFHWG